MDKSNRYFITRHYLLFSGCIIDKQIL